MRAVLGVVGLLIVVALVGLLARKQLDAVVAIPDPAQAVPGAPSVAADPATSSRQLQRRVADDVAEALDQAARRTSEAAQ